MKEFEEMSWREFTLKSYAYRRMEKERLEHTRLISYYSILGHFDPKKAPTIEQFMPLEKIEVDTSSLDLFKKRLAEWRSKQQ